jgi:hypothetical protein
MRKMSRDDLGIQDTKHRWMTQQSSTESLCWAALLSVFFDFIQSSINTVDAVAQTQEVAHPQTAIFSNFLQHLLLELPLNLLAGLVRSRLAVETEKSTEVELGCLEEFDLADVYLEESA